VNKIKNVFAALAVSALVSPLVSANTIRANVNGMVCAFCAQGIDRNLRGTGVAKDVYINLKQRVVALELKPNSTITTEKFSAIIKEAGYEVTNVETVATTADEIRQSLKGK
jgi:periplasmic mercuric ion binding protein